jgi:hypothetical protein
MADEEQLQAEARERSRMVFVAAAAAVLTFAATVIGFLPGQAPHNLPAELLFFHEHQALLALGIVCSALSSVAIAIVLAFLYKAVRLRSESAPAQLRWLPWVGGIGAALLFVVAQTVLSIQVAHFATHGTQTYAEAKKATATGALGILAPIAQLLLVAAIVVVSLNAMRVGLLTRLLGYTGIAAAVLFLVPVLPLPVVQVYWLGALAALFAGRYPQPIPPAWSRGEAVPWPSGAELREQRVRAAEARRGGEDAAPAAVAPAESGAARRKRKKRR